MIKQEVKVETKRVIKLEKPNVFDETNSSIELNEAPNSLYEEPAIVVAPCHIDENQTLAHGGNESHEHTSSVKHRTIAVGGIEPAEHTSCRENRAPDVISKKPAEYTQHVGHGAPVISNSCVRFPRFPSFSKQTSSEFNSSNASLPAEINISQNIHKVNCKTCCEENLCLCFNCYEASIDACRNRPSFLEKPIPGPVCSGNTAPRKQPVHQDPNDLRNVLNATRKRKLQHEQYPLDDHLQQNLNVIVIPGKYSNKETYSRVVLVADRCFQPLTDLWSKNSEVIPDLLIKEDLKITDLEPIVNALINVCSMKTSKKMLIIAALRLNESFTFTPYKDCDNFNHKSLQCITLCKNKLPVEVFKALQINFESKVDLVFAHIIPAGWHLIQRSLIALHAVLEGHKVFSTELTGQTVMQAKSFVRNCSNVNSYLDVNGLSSVNGWPCWNLLPWKASVIKKKSCCLSNLPVQNNGKDLTSEALQTIAFNVCKFSHIYQKHSTSAIPSELCNFRATPSQQAETEARTFSKLILITDAKLGLLEKKWPEHFSLQPQMQFSGVLKPSKLLNELLATRDQTKETFFIFCPSIRNLLLVQQVVECKDHDPLKYPSCRTGVGQDSTVENTVFQRIQKFKSSILENFQNSRVALSTVHSIKFQMILDNLCTKHQTEFGHVLPHLNESSFTNKQTKSLQIGIDTLNGLIVEENRRSELPSFDVFDFIDVNNSSNLSKYLPDGMNLSEEAISILADRFTENLTKFNKNVFFHLNQSLHLSSETNETIENQDVTRAEEINDQVIDSEATPSITVPQPLMIKIMPQWQSREIKVGECPELHTAVEETQKINLIVSEDGWRPNSLLHTNSGHSSKVDYLCNGYKTLNSVAPHNVQMGNQSSSESHSNDLNCIDVKSHKAPIPIESVNRIGHIENEQTYWSTHQITSSQLRDHRDGCYSDTSEDSNVTNLKFVEQSHQTLNCKISPVCSLGSPLTSQKFNMYKTILPECDQAFYGVMPSSSVVKEPPNKSSQAVLRASENNRPVAVASSSSFLKKIDNWYTFQNNTAATQTMTNRPRPHCFDLDDSFNNLPLLNQIPSLYLEPTAQTCIKKKSSNISLQPSFESSHVLENSELHPTSLSSKSQSSPNYQQHLTDYQPMPPHRDRQSPNLLEYSPESSWNFFNYRNSSNKHRPFADHCRRSPKHRRHSSEDRRPSPEYQHPSPECKRPSPECKRPSPECRRHASEYRRHSPDRRHHLPDRRHHLPEHRSRSPEFRRHSVEHRPCSPVYRCLSPKRRRHSPEYKRCSAEYRRSSPKNRRRSHEHRRRSHEQRRCFPEYRRCSPEHRRCPPEHRRCPPEHRRCSPEYRCCSPEYRRCSPEHRRCSPEHRRSSLEHRRCSPEHRRNLPLYRLCSPRCQLRSPEYLQSANDRQHSPSSVHLSGHHRPLRGRQSKKLSRSLEGSSHSPVFSISSNDSLLDTGRSRCYPLSNMTEMCKNPQQDDHAADLMDLSKKQRKIIHPITDQLKGKSNAKKHKKKLFKVSSPFQSHSRCSVNSTSNCFCAKKNTSPCECQYLCKSTGRSNNTADHLHSSDRTIIELKRKKQHPVINGPKLIFGVQGLPINAHRTVLKLKPCDKPICTTSKKRPSREMVDIAFECRSLGKLSLLSPSVCISRHLSKHDSVSQHFDHEAKSTAKKTKATKHGSSEGLEPLLRPLGPSISQPQAPCQPSESPEATFSTNKFIKDQLRLKREEASRLEAIALRSLWSFHGQECEKYLEDPSTHPAYEEERRVYIESCITSAQSSVSEAQGFFTYFKNKLDEILQQTWQQRKKKCLDMIKNLQSYCNPCTLLMISTPTNSKQQKHGNDTIDCDEKSLHLLKVLRMKMKWQTKKRTNLVEQLRTGGINCKKSLGLLNQIKLTNDELVRMILNESLLMQDDHASFVQSDPCNVLITLRILAQMPEIFESLSVSISMMLRTLLTQQQKVDFFLRCFSRYDKIFLKMALCKLKELDRKSLEEVQNVVVNEAHDRLQALLFRLLDYSDPFFGLNIDSDDDAVEFAKIVNAVYFETRVDVEEPSVSSMVIILLSMAVRRALTKQSPILSSDESIILESKQVEI